MGVCNCSRFCCTLLYVHSSIAIILMGKRELVALLDLSSWCFVSGSSSLCHGVVCSLRLLYFLIILTYYFCVENVNIAQNLHDTIADFGLPRLLSERSYGILMTSVALPDDQNLTGQYVNKSKS